MNRTEEHTKSARRSGGIAVRLPIVIARSAGSAISERTGKMVISRQTLILNAKLAFAEQTGTKDTAQGPPRQITSGETAFTRIQRRRPDATGLISA
jgi:hypothetical protein